MRYEVYLRRDVFEFVRRLPRQDRDAVLTLFEALGQDPYRRGDFADHDASGREIEVLVFRRYAIWYWADHAVS